MKHGRLPWFEPHELSAEQRAIYDDIAGGPRAQGPQAFALTDGAGRLEGPFNAMLVEPAIGGALQALGSAIRYRSPLTARAREIAILEVAALRRSAFEWYAHERVGRLAGLTDTELSALASGAAAASFDATETIVRAVVRALIVERDLGDALYAEAEAALGTPVVAYLIALAGYYDLLSLQLRAWRTPLPAGAQAPFAPDAEG